MEKNMDKENGGGWGMVVGIGMHLIVYRKCSQVEKKYL
jgi:hypothetical protein